MKDLSLSSNGANPGGKSRVEMIVAQLASLDESELFHVRAAIENLQPTDLEKLDLNAELALQFRQAKLLLTEVQKEAGVPANQKAQIFNSVRAQLADIVKQQESVWGMERLKTFEQAVLKVLKALPQDMRDLFFDLYCKHLPNGTFQGTPIADVGKDGDAGAAPEPAPAPGPAPKPAPARAVGP